MCEYGHTSCQKHPVHAGWFGMSFRSTFESKPHLCSLGPGCLSVVAGRLRLEVAPLTQTRARLRLRPVRPLDRFSHKDLAASLNFVGFILRRVNHLQHKVAPTPELEASQGGVARPVVGTFGKFMEEGVGSGPKLCMRACERRWKCATGCPVSMLMISFPSHTWGQSLNRSDAWIVRGI